MPDTSMPPPAPLEPGVAAFPPPSGREKSRGCLKWGLVGCAGLSLVVIIGLVFLMTKAKSFVGTELTKKGQEVVQSATPEVSEEQKVSFLKSYAGFVERVKDGKAPFGKIAAASKSTDAVLQDRRVTPEEIVQLTAELEAAR